MRTFDQSASSSSAMMSGSEVIDPCPISVAADMMVMVPSGVMLIHGLMVCPAPSAARTAASVRRPSEVSKLLRGLFMSRLPRRALDRAHDALIGAAATDIRAHVLDDLVARGLGLLLQEIGRAHDLAGLAVAALRHALGKPGFLNRMTAVGRQAFDGGDRFARELGE